MRKKNKGAQIKKAIFGVFVIILSIFFISISCTDNREKDKSFEPKRMTEDSAKQIVASILIDSIHSYINQDKLKDALEMAKTLVIKCPNNSEAYNEMGNVCLVLGYDSIAQINLSLSLELDSQNYKALTNYGILNHKKNKFEIATEYYLRALEINPNFVPTYSNLMGNFISLHDYEKARIYGEKSVHLGNLLSDKGLLCAVYNKLGLNNKRDSLFAVLKEAKYKNIDKLKQLFIIKK